RYHCSQDAALDPEGVDRLKGRLYRLRYKNTPRAPKIDLASESDGQLIARLGSGNIYFRETAQRILTERLGSAAASASPVGASPTGSAARGGVSGENAEQRTRRRVRSLELRTRLEMLVLGPVGADVRRLKSKSEINQSLVTSAATAT